MKNKSNKKKKYLYIYIKMSRPVTQEELKQVVDNLNSNIVGTANAISQNLVGTANNLQENQNGLQNQIINVTEKFPNLGIYSEGDLPSLIKGPWQVYKMETQQGPAYYRYISRNDDVCLCVPLLPNVQNGLSEDDIEGKKGLILSITGKDGGHLCSTKTDQNSYYGNYNANPFVYETENFPFRLTLPEVQFIFTKTTFTESSTISKCVWTSGQNVGKPATAAELLQYVGAQYFKASPIFVGTTVATFKITQDDIDTITNEPL